MKRWEKAFIAVLAVLVFFVSGGIACTYATSGLNLALVAVLGTLVFIGSGFAACTYSNRKMEKRKANQIA